jgi:hypothetical protein
MVEQMMERGIDRDMILLAIRTVEATLPATLPATRSRKAINQANYRARQSAKSGESVALAASTEPITPSNAVTGNVTSAPLSILSSLTESQSGIQEVSKEKKKEEASSEPREKKPRGARLPDDWQPSEADRTNRTDKQAAKPRWDRAWQNWILNVRPGSNGTAPRAGSKDDTRERTVNALRALDPFPYRDDVGRSEGPGSPVSRQLSLVKPS